MYHMEVAFHMLGKAQSKCSVEKNENCIENDLHFLISHSRLLLYFSKKKMGCGTDQGTRAADGLLDGKWAYLLRRAP
jgi:hypothetical protein